MTDYRKTKREERNARLSALVEKGQAAGLWTVTSVSADVDNWGAWAYVKDPEGLAYVLRAEDDDRLYGDVDSLAFPFGGQPLHRSDVGFRGDAPFSPPTFGMGLDSLALLRAIKRRLLDAGRPYAQALKEAHAARLECRQHLEAHAEALKALGWRVDMGTSSGSATAYSGSPQHLRATLYDSGRLVVDRLDVPSPAALAAVLAVLEEAQA